MIVGLLSLGKIILSHFIFLYNYSFFILETCGHFDSGQAPESKRSRAGRGAVRGQARRPEMTRQLGSGSSVGAFRL